MSPPTPGCPTMTEPAVVEFRTSREQYRYTVWLALGSYAILAAEIALELGGVRMGAALIVSGLFCLGFAFQWLVQPRFLLRVDGVGVWYRPSFFRWECLACDDFAPGRVRAGMVSGHFFGPAQPIGRRGFVPSF